MRSAATLLEWPSSRWLRLAYSVSAVAATVFLGISSATPAAGKLTTIADVLQPYVDRHELAEAVAAVVTKQGIVTIQAVGFANQAQKKPMQPDALFWIASMSKPLVATALMTLVDTSKVRLDDPVASYLPDFKEVMTKKEPPLWLAVTSVGHRQRGLMAAASSRLGLWFE